MRDSELGPPLKIPDAEAYNRLIARNMIERLDRFDRLASDQVVSQSRWLNASLLALNSASILGALQIAKGASLTPVAFFVLGVIASLLSGVVLQEAYRIDYPKRIGRWGDYWYRVEQTGERDLDFETATRKSADRGSILDWLAPSLGWISGALWTTGVVTIALS